MNNDVVSEGNQIHYSNNLNASDEIPPPLPPRTHSLISKMMLSNGSDQKANNQTSDINENETISNNNREDGKTHINKKLDNIIKDGNNAASIDKNIANFSENDNNIMSDVPLPPLPDHISEHDNNDDEDDSEDEKERDDNECYDDNTDVESDMDSHKVIKQNNINQKLYEKTRRLGDVENNDINQNHSLKDGVNNEVVNLDSNSCDKIKLNGVDGGTTSTKDITNK